jgi:hypothetical protein
MSKARLYRLEQRLCCNLPASPWQAVENPTTGFIHILDAQGRQIARVDRGWDLAEQTARFLAQAREDLGYLVEEVLRSWERIGELEEDLARLLCRDLPTGGPEVAP